eukprot:6053647-Amphidinium_carterae.1
MVIIASLFLFFVALSDFEFYREFDTGPDTSIAPLPVVDSCESIRDDGFDECYSSFSPQWKNE